MSLLIHTLGRAELHLVTELSARIWPIAYSEIITQEQIKYMLNTMYSQQALEQNLSDGHVFLLAELDGKHKSASDYKISNFFCNRQFFL